jgi:alcohol dehydrogenase YqhD (iron-dependent ADH family)
MNNFEAYNPTTIHFGKDVTSKLGETIKLYGKNVLLIYGKGSIKNNGIYQKVISQLDTINANIVEYSGIKSNPIIEDVNNAAQIGKLEQVDVILAVGGGSVIDTAKITSLAIANNTHPWAIMKFKSKTEKAIPIITVLTLAATGTEMNAAAVIQNHETKEKIGFVSPLIFPKHSFLDPQFTYSVSKEYTAYGIVDLIAHSFESYFGKGECSLSDRIVEAIVMEAIEYAPKVLKEPQNYDYRANIMWQATSALNGSTIRGKSGGDWGVHAIGHNISLMFDIPHGATLSIVYPAWLRLFKNKIPEKIAQLGNRLFGTNTADETIEQLEMFFKSVNSPTLLSDVNINIDKKEEIIEQMVKTKVNGYAYELNNEDRKQIVELMFNGG